MWSVDFTLESVDVTLESLVDYVLQSVENTNPRVNILHFDTSVCIKSTFYSVKSTVLSL